MDYRLRRVRVGFFRDGMPDRTEVLIELEVGARKPNDCDDGARYIPLIFMPGAVVRGPRDLCEVFGFRELPPRPAGGW